MQWRRKDKKIRVIGSSRKKIAGRFRPSVLAALSVSLVCVVSAVWHPGLAMAQTPVETELGIALSTTQEVPAIATPSTAKGVGKLTVSADQTTINYSFTLTGPFTGDPLQGHIHVGPTGSSGPIIFFLCATDPANPSPAPPGVPVCPQAAGGDISGILTEASFIPQPDAGIATFADAIAALSRGDAYVNFHTPANPTGELRGQIGGIGLGGILSSAVEVPPVTTASTASGTLTLAITPDRSQMAFKLTLTGPFTGDPQQAHIHVGAADGSGPIVFFLCATDPATPAPAPAGVQVCPTATGGEISGLITKEEFIPQPGAGIETYADAIDALISGGAYVNVHTPANPTGEIRGQLGIAVQTDLNSANEVPPVATPTTATGTALMVLSQDHSQIDYAVTLTGPFTGDPQQMHIHVGPSDGSGPIILFNCATDPAVPAPAPAGEPICPPAAGGPVSGTLTEASLIPQPDAGIATFADAVAALLNGGTYINVHTPANPGGEIRGQLTPVQPESAAPVSFAIDIQPIFDANCSCHIFGTSGGLSLAPGQSYANLVNVPSRGVPTINRVQPGDPENSYLYMKHTGAPGIVGQRMPLDNPTFFDENPALLQLEHDWIQQGALNN